MTRYPTEDALQYCYDDVEDYYERTKRPLPKGSFPPDGVLKNDEPRRRSLTERCPEAP
jgi:hypothetical protein